jgi:tetratricopeptide (TPR) repeat protein
MSACSFIHRGLAIGTVEIRQQDLEDLRNGRLLAVRERYEARQPELNDRELALLCDIYVKHVSITRARECLDQLEKRRGTTIATAINGKRALIDYLLGEYEHAAARSRDLTSDGGRYVYALSRVKLGDNQPAINLAADWELSYQPPQVFLAANLLLATKQYDKVLETLQDPERRLDRDYNLSGSVDIFGYHIDPAPLRVDLFGEFGFGLIDTFSYAPRSNVYVEYTLAKAELEIGQIDKARKQIDKVRKQIDKARKRYDTILAFPWIGAYRDIEWRALSDRASISEFDGETDRAIELYKQSVDVIESARTSITTDAGRIGFVGDKQEVYGHLVRLSLARGNFGAAFEYSERGRSRALVDLLASVRQFGVQSEYDTTIIRARDQAEIELSDGQDEADPKKLEGPTRYLIAPNDPSCRRIHQWQAGGTTQAPVPSADG